MHHLLRFVGLVMIRVFYRTIAIVRGERVPAKGPVVVVANHPNGLLDPLVARVALGRPLSFLAKSTLFANPFGRLAMRAFDAIPVYRPKDGADTSKNEETFRLCRELLARDGWLMLFPEGVSHAEPTLQRLKTGAARIVLSSDLPGIKVLPLGLVFDARGTFRSQAAVNVGELINAAPYFEQAKTDERAAVVALTERIGEAVSAAMLEAETAEIWSGLLAVAAWTGTQSEPDHARVTERAKVLEGAYRRLVVTDPDRAQSLVDRTRRFAHLLRSVGVDDPFSLESPDVLRPARLVRFALALALLSPFALVGWVLGVVPYQLIGLIAGRVTKDEDVLGTVKGVGGIVFYPLFWGAEAIAVGLALGLPAGICTLVAGPACGWITLRILERLAVRREAIGGWWMRMSRAELADGISRQRRKLAADIDAALAETPSA